MRVLLLGATGFVGKHLLEQLSITKECMVDAIVHNRLPEKEHTGVRYIKLNFENISYEFLKAGNYDVIFHLARIPGKGFGDLGRWYAGRKGNRANKKLVDHITKLNKQPKLVYLSGSLMYGHNPAKTVYEEQELNTIGFARYYYAAEKPLLDAMEKNSFPVIMLRAPWIIGRGSWFELMYGNPLKTRHELCVYGDDSRYMSVVTGEDCAGLLLHYSREINTSIVGNIYTFQKISNADFVSMVERSLPGTVVRRHYSDPELKKMLGRTMAQSICSEIVLGTRHTDVLSAYKIKFPDLETYIHTLL